MLLGHMEEGCPRRLYKEGDSTKISVRRSVPQSEGNPLQTPHGQTERMCLNNKQWKAWNSGFGSNQSWRGVGYNSVFIVFLLSFCASAEHEVILVDTDAASRWALTDTAEFKPNFGQCLPFLGPNWQCLSFRH